MHHQVQIFFMFYIYFSETKQYLTRYKEVC